MDRSPSAFAEGLLVAVLAIAVVGLCAIALFAWGVARLRHPNRGLGSVLLAASVVPLLPLFKWLTEGSLASGRPAEWAIPILLTVVFGTLGTTHFIAARRREVAMLEEARADEGREV